MKTSTSWYVLAAQPTKCKHSRRKKTRKMALPWLGHIYSCRSNGSNASGKCGINLASRPLSMRRRWASKTLNWWQIGQCPAMLGWPWLDNSPERLCPFFFRQSWSVVPSGLQTTIGRELLSIKNSDTPKRCWNLTSEYAKKWLRKWGHETHLRKLAAVDLLNAQQGAGTISQ